MVLGKKRPWTKEEDDLVRSVAMSTSQGDRDGPYAELAEKINRTRAAVKQRASMLKTGSGYETSRSGNGTSAFSFHSQNPIMESERFEMIRRWNRLQVIGSFPSLDDD